MQRSNLIMVFVVVISSLSIGIIVTAPWSISAADEQSVEMAPAASAVANPSPVPVTSPDLTQSPTSTASPAVVASPTSLSLSPTATPEVNISIPIQIVKPDLPTVEPSAAVGIIPGPALSATVGIITTTTPTETVGIITTTTPTDIAATSAAPLEGFGFVGNTDGEGVFVRPAAVLADTGTAWRDGTELVLIGAEADADGQNWYYVRDPAGGVGWVPARYVIQSTATDTPTSPPAQAPAELAAPPPAHRAISNRPPSPTSTPTPLPPTATPTQLPPTAMPTPSYDYVVVSFREIPRPGGRDVASIRGRLIDRNGALVAGAHFDIKSDSLPNPWTATEPHAGPADGTVEFAVSRGSFAVRVDGGRSQDAGWMLTGRPGVPEMSDWEFVLQATY